MHTPGPWIESDGFVMSSDGDFVCDPHCNGGPTDHAERDANARLIAAAPELLAVCESLLAHAESEHQFYGNAGIEKAKAAIAKAKGKPDATKP